MSSTKFVISMSWGMNNLEPVSMSWGMTDAELHVVRHLGREDFVPKLTIANLPIVSCASSIKALGPSQRLPPPSRPEPDAPTTSSMSTSAPLARCPPLAAPHGPVARSRTRTRARPQRIGSRASTTRAPTTRRAGSADTSPAERQPRVDPRKARGHVPTKSIVRGRYPADWASDRVP